MNVNITGRLMNEPTNCHNHPTMRKALRETQTLRADCSKAEPKFFAMPQTPSRGHGMAKI